jgi:hypothetical protein
LSVTLPDGTVGTRRTYRVPDHWLNRATDPARQADEREWVAAELPGAVEQLYARAGLEQPTGRAYEALRAKVRTLVDTFPAPARPRLLSVDDPDRTIAETIERIRLLMGDVDQSSRHLDAMKTAFRVDLGDTSDEHLVALVTQMADASQDDVVRRLARLATMFGFAEDFDGMDEAVAGDLERRREQAEQKGRAAAFGELMEALDLKGVIDDPFEAILGVLQNDRSVVKALAESHRRGQLDVLEALDVDASGLPADADLTVWAKRAAQTWYAEARQPLESALTVERSYLACLLRALGVGTEHRHDQVRSGELRPDELAQLVGDADHAAAERRKGVVEAARLRFEIGTLLNFFQLPEATPDEQIAGRVIKAATKSIQGAAEGARAAERKAGPDVEEGARQRRELDKLLMHFGLPGDTSTVEIARRVTEKLQADRAVADGELTILRAALAAAGELFKSISPMESEALRAGRVQGQALESMASGVHRMLVTRFAELGVLRFTAAELAHLAGASAEKQSEVASGELAAQALANRLRDYKAALRKNVPTDELATSNRIIADIAAKVGSAELRSTLVPGAVGDLVRTADAQAEILTMIRDVVMKLGKDIVDPSVPDELLASFVQYLILAARYPVGATLDMGGTLLVVRRIQTKLPNDRPIVAVDAGGYEQSVDPTDVRGVEFTKPGEFHTGDGRKATAFTLPEGGLADILRNAPWTERHPARVKVEEAAAGLADKVERFGDRWAKRIGDAAERVQAEIDEAVENARKEGGK